MLADTLFFLFVEGSLLLEAGINHSVTKPECASVNIWNKLYDTDVSLISDE